MHDSINRLLSYQPEKMYLTHYGEITDIARLAEQLHEAIDKQVSFNQMDSRQGQS
ncbi:hypothetical protein BGS_0711 [Beggiatoa sp. SS]|nr:hypothetical protein BGS_0711 [Beggiatoa sp. SS]